MNEGATAVFKIEDCAEEYMSEILRRVTYCVAVFSIELPGHLVCFRGVVLDTEVPDMDVGYEHREIWRALLSEFFTEYKLSSCHLEKYMGPL